MNEIKLICNYKSCFKEIKIKGWVTACSHIFCNGHGENLRRMLLCPACESSLKLPFSVLETNINPSREIKNMMLMGFRPEDILEASQKALCFWNSQIYQKMSLERKKVQYYQEKLSSLESKCERKIQMLEQKIQDLNKKLELEIYKNKNLNLKLLENQHERSMNLSRRSHLSHNQNARRKEEEEWLLDMCYLD